MNWGYNSGWYWGWDGFYDFVLHELFPKEVKKYGDFKKYIDVAHNLHSIYPYEEICFVLDRPAEIHLGPEINGRRRLHNFDKPALLYRDGYAVHSIHGVRVPDWIVNKKAEELDPKEVLAIKDVDVRVRAVQKIGAPRMIEKLGAKVIDQKKCLVGGQYELLEVEWTGTKRKYLKMTNQSTGQIHIEAVPPQCETVDMAEGSREEDLVGKKWEEKKYKHPRSAWLT